MEIYTNALKPISTDKLLGTRGEEGGYFLGATLFAYGHLEEEEK